MVKIEFCCDKCGNKEYRISHGYASGIGGFAYSLDCAKCYHEEEIGNEYDTKVSD